MREAGLLQPKATRRFKNPGLPSHNVMTCLCVALLCAKVLAAADSTAEEQAEKYRIYSPEWNAIYDAGTVYKGDILLAHLKILGLQLGAATVADVESKLGKPSMYVEKGSHSMGLCYVSDREGDETKLVFSTGYMGDWKEILSFNLISEDIRYNESNACRESSFVSRVTTTATGIKLGMSPRKVKEILGSPSKEEAGRFVYVYNTRKPASPELFAACSQKGSSLWLIEFR